MGQGRLRRALLAGLLLTGVAVPAADATFPGTNGRILYTTQGYAPRDVRSVCPDGTGDRLVKANAVYGVPSPDGTRIVYEGMFDRPAAERGIWVMNIDGSGTPVRIADASHTPHFPTWSPDGTKVAFIAYVGYAGHSSKAQPVWAPADGSGDLAFTPFLDDPGLDGGTSLSWTADNQWLIFNARTGAVGTNLYKVPSNGGPATLLAGDGQTWHFTGIETHPSADRIMAVRQDIEANVAENWEFDSSGGGHYVSPAPALGSPEEQQGDDVITWSPDGQQSVMVMHRGSPIHQLGIGDADGKNPVGIPGAFGASLPHWINGDLEDCKAVENPDFGNMRVNEVGVSFNGSTAPRYIELIAETDEDFPAEQGPYMVRFWDVDGKQLGGHFLSTAELQSRDNRQPLLIGSVPSVPNAFGITPDRSYGFPASARQACFVSGTPERPQGCVAWGCETKPFQAGVARAAAPPDGRSIQRQGVLSDVFHIATPTPKATNVPGTAASCGSGAGAGGGGGGASGGGDGGAPGGGSPFTPFGGTPSGPAGGGADSSSSPRPRLSVPSSVRPRGGAVTVTVTCATGGGQCKGSAVLQTVVARGKASAAAARPTRLASARVNVRAGRRAKVKLKLTKRARSLVRRKRKVRAELVVRITGAKAIKKRLTVRR
jgi:hypothetical protein